MSHPAKFSRMRRRNARRLSQPSPPKSFTYWLRRYYREFSWPRWWDSPTPLARYLADRTGPIDAP
jgi:hypothetical protein